MEEQNNAEIRNNELEANENELVAKRLARLKGETKEKAKEKAKRGRKPKTKSVESSEDSVPVSVDLPVDVHRKLRAIAGCTYKSAREVMVEFITRGVQSFEQKNGEIPFWKL